jgi:hypothetical protein
MRLFCISILLVVHAAPTWAENQISLERSERGVTVRVDDSLFAEYLTRSGRQPVVWPIIGPTGAAYTRSFPVGPLQESEEEDHVHHRSLWFAHGDVNGFDFWSNAHGEQSCEILHREFVTVESNGATATVVTRNDWVASGKKQCEVIIPAGEHLTLRYRVVFHRGDQKAANIQERYQSFTQNSTPEVAVP